jgi:hypothetical protein
MKISTKHFKKWWELKGAKFCDGKNNEKEFGQHICLGSLYKDIAKQAYCDGLQEGVLICLGAKEGEQ